MLSFNYCSPVEIRFGYGSRDAIAQIAGRFAGRGFLVVDACVEKSPLFQEFMKTQGSLFAGMRTQTRSNPSLQCVQETAEQVTATGAQFLVAIGGGSSIDAAKAAALSAATQVPISEYHAGRMAVGATALPLVAMPTTSGTGSEVTAVAVLTDEERAVKAPIGGPALLPRVAVVDPEWTLSVPSSVTAGTGMDALSHALEAYWSVNAQPICDSFAESAARVIMGSLEECCWNGTNRQHRENMALGSLLAGLAFAAPKTAAVHACSFPLTNRYGMPHGVACAFTLDAFVRYNAVAIPEKLGRISRLLGFDGPEQLADSIAAMKKSLGLPCTLEQAGIPIEKLDELVAESFHPNILNNPRSVSPEDLRAIYQSMQEERVGTI